MEPTCCIVQESAWGQWAGGSVQRGASSAVRSSPFAAPPLSLFVPFFPSCIIRDLRLGLEWLITGPLLDDRLVAGHGGGGTEGERMSNAIRDDGNRRRMVATAAAVHMQKRGCTPMEMAREWAGTATAVGVHTDGVGARRRLSACLIVLSALHLSHLISSPTSCHPLFRLSALLCVSICVDDSMRTAWWCGCCATIRRTNPFGIGRTESQSLCHCCLCPSDLRWEDGPPMHRSSIPHCTALHCTATAVCRRGTGAERIQPSESSPPNSRTGPIGLSNPGSHTNDPTNWNDTKGKEEA